MSDVNSVRSRNRRHDRRDTSRQPSTSSESVNVLLAGLVAASLVALIGIALALIITMGTWALAPHSDSVGPDETARVAVGMWLYTHHVPVTFGGVPLSVVPLGLMLIPGLLCYAGGRQVSRVVGPRTLPEAIRAVIPYALMYGILAAIAAGIVRSDLVQPAPRTAFFAATAIALAAGSFGLLRASGHLGEAVSRIPLMIRSIVAAATAGLATVIVVSAMFTALALAVGFPDSVEMYRALDAGWAGGLALLLLTVAFVPNLVLWTASFTTGVGFHLGPDGIVSPQGVDYGALPVFPPLAALPPEGDAGWLAFLGLLAPLLGGVAVAVVLHRRTSSSSAPHSAASERVALRAAAAGGLSGVVLGVLAWLSAGSAGSEGLTSLGPIGWQVGLVAALEMGLIAAVLGWELHRRDVKLSTSRTIDLREWRRTIDLRRIPNALRRRRSG